MEFASALAAVKYKLDIGYGWNKEQVTGFQALCEGRNVFAILPTGFGKSDLFAIPPLVMDMVST